MQFKNTVRWLDGIHDTKRTCDECGLETCPYPVHKDYYKEKVISKAYYNWQKGNQ